MNEQIAKQILDIIKSSKDFVLEQAPDVARQTVTYGRIVDTILVALLPAALLFFAAFSIIVLRLAAKNDSEYSRTETIQGYWILSGCMFLVTGVIFLISIGDFIQVWMTPKLYLLNYFTHLAKG